MYWIYKCNTHQEHYHGDWDYVYADKKTKAWGSQKENPRLADAKKGHIIIACQSNRNELVGLAKVTGWSKNDELMLKPEELIRAKIRPLKKADAQINKIPALQSGQIKTLYAISDKDAKRLIAAARKSGIKTKKPTPKDIGNTKKRLEKSMQGAGFGSAKDNKIVEQAAMKRAKRFYKNGGYSVKDVSSRNFGYDLLCSKGSNECHVEVKGVKGNKHQFIITERELRILKSDKDYAIALVTSALSKYISITLYERSEVLKVFDFTPIAHIAAYK